MPCTFSCLYSFVVTLLNYKCIGIKPTITGLEQGGAIILWWTGFYSTTHKVDKFILGYSRSKHRPTRATTHQDHYPAEPLPTRIFFLQDHYPPGPLPSITTAHQDNYPLGSLPTRDHYPLGPLPTRTTSLYYHCPPG